MEDRRLLDRRMEDRRLQDRRIGQSRRHKEVAGTDYLMDGLNKILKHFSFVKERNPPSTGKHSALNGQGTREKFSN